MGFSGAHLVLQICSSPAGSIFSQTLNSSFSSADHEESLRRRLGDQIAMKTKLSPRMKIHHKSRRSRCFGYAEVQKRGNISVVYAHVQTCKGSDQWKNSNLYQVLGLSFGATREEIKASYRRLARLHHPDAAPPDEKGKSAQDFMDIHSAYTTLSNPNSRADYDQRLVTSMKICNGGIYGGQWRPGRCWETDQCL